MADIVEDRGKAAGGALY